MCDVSAASRAPYSVHLLLSFELLRVLLAHSEFNSNNLRCLIQVLGGLEGWGSEAPSRKLMVALNSSLSPEIGINRGC